MVTVNECLVMAVIASCGGRDCGDGGGGSGDASGKGDYGDDGGGGDGGYDDDDGSEKLW